MTLRDPHERDQLLSNFSDSEVDFLRNQDQEDSGSQKSSILQAPNPFSMKGMSFIKDAMVQCQECTSSGFSNRQQLRNITRFPCTVRISDTSDQDTCNACGHHRSRHFHDMREWKQVEDTNVDPEMKKKYEQAEGLKAKKEAAAAQLEAKMAQNKTEQDQLGVQLMAKIREFENHGMSRNYALLLQNQRDLLEQHIQATVEGDDGADVGAMKGALKQIEEQLHIVQNALKQTGAMPKEEWARLMLGAEKRDSLDKCERLFRQQAKRMHPDKFGGNEDRMKQLQQAIEILRASDTWFTRAKNFFTG